MQAIVGQHPQSNLSWQFKKLFFIRLLAENSMVFLLQYMGLMFSTLTPEPMPAWFASGTACAFIFMRGLTILPGIWLGSVMAFYFADIDLTRSCLCACVFALQAFLLMHLSFSFIAQGLIFQRASILLKFILCAGILSAAASFMLEWICTAEFNLQIGLQWWLANLNGTLIVSFAIATWDSYFPDIYTLKTMPKRILLFAYGSLILSIMALSFSPCAALFILPLTLFISLRYGWCGAVGAAFLFAFLLCLWGSIFRITGNILFLQLLLLFCSLGGFFLGLFRVGRTHGGFFHRRAIKNFFLHRFVKAIK
jgi:hypothetical protein